MVKGKKEQAGRGFIDPMMVTILCLHGVFAGLGLMVLAVVHH
ncbi:hypothetical protein [Legionella feeleii]|uniref:Uncharacterized protein n=1 Tax=Legionella feeleii TaxID=453 RepID=A0A378KKF9_9GAMM|nr:hypothetical protein [Legionella feeleii]STX88318.1 Uncharacterised protein [Legionella feeleii]